MLIIKLRYICWNTLFNVIFYLSYIFYCFAAVMQVFVRVVWLYDWHGALQWVWVWDWLQTPTCNTVLFWKELSSLRPQTVGSLTCSLLPTEKEKGICYTQLYYSWASVFIEQRTQTNAEIVLIFVESGERIKASPAAVGCRWLGKENMFHYSIPGPDWEHRNRLNREDKAWQSPHYTTTTETLL